MKFNRTLRSLCLSLIVCLSLAIALYFGGEIAHSAPPNITPRPLETAVFEQAVQAANQFVMPGEFDAIESVWMATPVYENRQGHPTQPVQAEMINALTSQVFVDLMVQDDAEAKQVTQWIDRLKLNRDRIRLHIVPHTDIWTRDMGPIFLRNAQGDRRIADFGFNTWSYNDSTHPDAMLDEQADRQIARDLKLPVMRSSLISEGGNREFNGKGTLMVTEAVELQRNWGITKAEIEAEFQRIFNIKKVIWLKQGIADDDLSTKGKLPGDVFTVLTTGGHIDEFARFADPHTILLAQISPEERNTDPIARITADRLEENYRILRAATDQDGKPFRIIRVPIADPIYEIMDKNDTVFNLLKDLTFEDRTVIKPDSSITTILAASYLNFVTANNVVLMPSYWQPGRPETTRLKDEAVKKILQQAFPGRTIVPINPEAINAGGGGMHCIVQQMPTRTRR